MGVSCPRGGDGTDDFYVTDGIDFFFFYCFHTDLQINQLPGLQVSII